MKGFRIPNYFWYFLAVALCLPAFLINLDLITLNEDESIRALVALEMRLSGDYFTPTLNGTLYYSKPPLYNWILNISYTLMGSLNEWALRIPTLFFLMVYAFTIYYYSQKYYDRQFAFINAMLFVTCGRILFWDSMLGYIDMCYSWVTYMELMVIFHCYHKGQYLKMFLLSSFLAAVGFLLKGFPTILFQGLSLVVFFGYQKDLKRLLSKEHLFGILVFCAIVGSYYLYYYSANPEGRAITGLLDQSTRRTLMHDTHTIWDFFRHLIIYPFQNTYDFFPWSIMVIYLFRRDLLKILFKNEFIKYCAIIFGVNILVYWASIEVYPRYILMLIPILFSVFLYLHKLHYEDETVLYKVFIYFSIATIIVGAFLGIVFPFMERLNDVSIPILKGAAVSVSLIFIAYYFYHHKQQRLITLISALLIIRIGFNWFILPDRHEHDPATAYKQQAISVGERYKDEDLRIWERTKIDYTSSFYISSTRGRITERDMEHEDEQVYYVIDEEKYQVPDSFEIVDQFQIRERDKILSIVQKK
ncbi:ArnT family glycosyltransferase [Portibacter marinus]|uniref:ArnT family glycosyltransferase n=1 Tax=Portibacter marinus TaxID=2898660 RepID=UPI001F417675|nr:glycosyltransferase family 39 protein [Portibacter marinus]